MLEKGANKNHIKYNKDKCKVLYLGKHKPGVQHKLGSTQLYSSFAERDLGVLADSNLNIREQCPTGAKKASKVLGCIKNVITIRYKEVVIPLSTISICQATPGILCSVLVSDIHNNVGSLERVQRRDVKVIKGLRSLTYKERLRELDLFSFEKRRLRRNLIRTFRYLKDGYKEE